MPSPQQDFPPSWKVGLYGSNGHQLPIPLPAEWGGEIMAAVGLAACPQGIHIYETLEKLLEDPEDEIVSLCSPRRADQAQNAIQCLRAGKHVYAEKPCAMTEQDLDVILAAAIDNGCQFREMAGTILEQPYRELHRLITQGTVGKVIQIFAQKSYPWLDTRPADEAIDGGLAMQAGIYITRFVEHIADCRIRTVSLRETLAGNPDPESACRMAASIQMSLECGGMATGICNYLNPMREVCWGYETLRIFGTEGVLETCSRTRKLLLAKPGQAPEPLNPSQPSEDYFQRFLSSLSGGTALPLTSEEEMRATRWIIRAKHTMQDTSDHPTL